MDTREIRQSNELAKKNQLIQVSFDQLYKIILPRIELVKNRDQWQTVQNSYPVDKTNLSDWWQNLKAVTIVRYLTAEEKKLINRNLIFPPNKAPLKLIAGSGDESYLFGEKLQLDEGFYVERTIKGVTELVVAKSMAPNDSVYETEQDRWQQQYGKLKMYLSKADNFFYNKNLLKQINSSHNNIHHIYIENRWNRGFSLLLDELKTDPPIIQGLEYDELMITKFKEAILKLSAVNLIFTPNFSVGLQDKSGDLYLSLNSQSPSNEKIHLTLFRRYLDKEGYFVINSEEPKVLFELESTAGAIFFNNVQDFWCKQVFASESLLGTTDESFSLSFPSGKKFDLLIPRAEEFDVKMLAPQGEVKIPPFRELFSLLVGTGRKANRVSELTIEQEQMIFQAPYVKMKIKNFDLVITVHGDEIVITNLTYRYQLHYLWGGKKAFAITANDYFYL